MEILLIFRYQQVTTQAKQRLTRKHDIPKTHDCKDGHIKMTTVIKVGFIFHARPLKSHRRWTLMHEIAKFSGLCPGISKEGS